MKVYIFHVRHNNIIKYTIVSANILMFVATCFGRIAVIFRPTYIDQVPISWPEDGCNAAETCSHELLMY